MNRLGNFAGVLGIAICVLSVFSRLINRTLFIEVSAINLFIVGVGFMVFGCFAKLSGR